MRSWEDICERCSLCCYEKTVWDDALVVDLSQPCEFLDTETHLCTVYDHRFKACLRCRRVHPFRAMFSNALPPTCGYVKWAEKFHLRFPEEQELVITEGDIQ